MTKGGMINLEAGTRQNLLVWSLGAEKVPFLSDFASVERSADLARVERPVITAVIRDLVSVDLIGSRGNILSPAAEDPYWTIAGGIFDEPLAAACRSMTPDVIHVH